MTVGLNHTSSNSGACENPHQPSRKFSNDSLMLRFTAEPEKPPFFHTSSLRYSEMDRRNVRLSPSVTFTYEPVNSAKKNGGSNDQTFAPRQTRLMLPQVDILFKSRLECISCDFRSYSQVALGGCRNKIDDRQTDLLATTM